MPKFSAETIGGMIEYDFTQWGGPKGIVAEPSKFAVKKFMKDTQAVFKSLRVVPEDAPDDISPNELVDTMNAIEDEELFERLTVGITECMAEVCGAVKIERETAEKNEQGFPVEVVTWEGGSPSHAALSALHYRPFMGFFGYLMQNLMSPEVYRPDTNDSPKRLRSV